MEVLLPRWLRWAADRRLLARVTAGGALVVLGLGAYLLYRTTRGCPDSHVAIQLAGDGTRLRAMAGDCDLPGGLGPSLLADLLLIAGYWWAGTIALAAYWPRYEAPLLRRATTTVLLLPTFVAVLDLLENGLMLVLVQVDAGTPTYSSESAGVLLGTVAWGKWSLAAVLAVVLVMAAAVAWSRRGETRFGRVVAKPTPAGPGAPIATGTGDDSVLGVCLSGGGIRSASFGLGVLSVLEQGGLMSNARYLSAVSGGSWAATSWTLERAFRLPREPDHSAADQVIDRLRGESYGIPRRRYLLNGPGGWLLPLGWVLLCAVVNLVLIAALVYALAWPVGKLLRSDYMSSGLGITRQPGFYIGILGLAVLVVSVASHRTARLRSPACGVMAIGAALLVLFRVDGLIDELDPFGPPAVAAVLAGVLTVLAGGFGRLLTAFLTALALPRLGKMLPRMLGVVLLVGALAWAVIVVYLVAVGPWSSWWVYGAGLAVLGGGYIVSNPNWPSLHNIFRKRLQRTFDPTPEYADQSQMLEDQPATWLQLRELTRGPAPGSTDGVVPELVLCCAQQRNGLSAGGLPAESFTISPFRVRRAGTDLDTENYLRAIPPKWPWSQSRKPFSQVSAWMATSGAAVSSAMGRASLGSTNAFLAAVNADLGMWLPNPTLVASTPPRERAAVFRRPNFAYLLKEILGWYDCADRFVFITDGGHWENLGLVELLRHGCDDIVCVDASGDAPGSFDTLRQALELATRELSDFEPPRDLDAALAPLRAVAGQLPRWLSTVLTARYGGSRVRIHYAKMQLDEAVPDELSAFAIEDPRFPGYSTARQMLSDKQVDMLIELGRYAGAQLLSTRERFRSPVASSNGTHTTRSRIRISAALTFRAAL